MKTLIFAMAGACLFVACNFSPATDSASNSNAPITPAINSFLPSLKTKLIQSFNIEAQSGGTVLTKEGTKLQIPANCFINPDGSPVKGTVNLSFAQYDNPLEIIASGIPMTMTTEGVEHVFESAGMFQLNGSANGKDIKIAEGKNVTVNLNTQFTDTNYSFFRFDEAKKDWVTLQNANTLAANTILPQAEPAETISAKMPEKPVEIKPHNANTQVFELNVDTKGLNQINVFKNILWTYAGKGTDPYQSDFLKVKWDNISLKRSESVENAYDAVCRKGERSVSTTVKPVLYGSQLKRAQKEYQRLLAAYNRQQELIKTEQRRPEIMMKAVRMLAVSSFGIYNCDRYWAPEVTQYCTKGFNPALSDGSNAEKIIQYYLINPDINSASYMGNQQFRFRTDCENYILAVLNNEKIAVCNPEEFRKINMDVTADLTFRVSEKTLDEGTNFHSLVGSM